MNTVKADEVDPLNPKQIDAGKSWRTMYKIHSLIKIK